MRTIETKVFYFEELSKEVQKKVIADNFNINVDDSFWYECVYDDCIQAGAIMGIEIDKIYFQMHCQGSGACFTGEYRYKKGSIKEIKNQYPKSQTLPIIAAELQKLQKKHFYSIVSKVRTVGNNCHENSTRFETFDQNIDNLNDDEIEDTLRSFMRWIYSMLEREYDYLTTNEAIINTIQANEYEFTEQGKQV
ncbi:MAG: hypothetical protein ACQ9ET_00145 [Nitrosomonadaceae bacterium]